MGGGMQPCNQISHKDQYNLAYIIHFILGVGSLLPWNTVITAVDYFGYLYPHKHVDKVFSVVYMGSSLPVLVGLVLWTKRPTSDRQYFMTVLAVTVCGLADGLAGGSLVGSVGELPERYMQAVFAGTACSGVLVSVLRIITKASLPQTPQGLQRSAQLYFIVSVLFMATCILCLNILHRLSIMKYYTDKKLSALPYHNSYIGDLKQINLTGTPMSTAFSTEQTNLKTEFWNTWKKIKWNAVGILMIYVVTLSIFPGYITDGLQSKILRNWYPILLITTYNVFDLVGKCLTAMYVPKATVKVVWACSGRLLFYPLFAACMHGPRFFRTEIPVVLLTSALGLTNGYLTSSLMILAPKCVPTKEAETVGIIMVLFLGIGLAAGSLAGWLWVI
ncbi:equilibrative nucleotide transporter 8-like isoform X2 [Nymphaea colorata]|uniref:equilibrative nucleotide transporter 8-like isoform X2 n=1 Tax=Nymphaea colorata TaxID=210225 RepID=UPI00214E49B9|nr:equilibrative nucleotide transporter 8-like isoform X2 [Nymphaea colorata]